MTIVEMTKKQVIDVLKREKLTHGRWGDGPDRARARSKACSFCAVGQVVRAAMSASASLDDVAEIAGDIGWDGNVFQALSDAFEDRYGKDYIENPSLDPDGEKGRRRAIAYVKSRRFPEIVRIDIGEAKPRRGMKVVR